MIYTLFCSCRKTRPFRINRLGTLCAGAKTSNPLFSVHCALFCKTGGWVPNTSAPSFAPAVICTTWRLYPLWPHSVAHTSRHHGGVLRVCVATRLDAAPILAGEEERGMANFLEYNPEQAYLLPPTVREVLGEGHLCFFVHGAVEKLDFQELEAGYSDEGHPAYHPALLLKVWLYAYAL